MITSQEPVVNPKAKYTIKETCSILGIHRNSLRKYRDEGLIKCSIKNRSQRYYGFEITRFWKRFV